MNNKTMKSISLASLFLLFSFNHSLFATSIKEHYYNAKALVKRNQKDKGALLRQLVEIRDNALLVKNPPPQDEVYLTKISSLLYWQNKFNSLSSTEPLNSKPKKPKRQKLQKNNDHDHSAGQKEKDDPPEKTVVTEKAPEIKMIKRDNDPYSQLLFYLKVQEDATTHKEGEFALFHIEKYYKIFSENNADSISKYLKKINNYEKAMSKKKFDQVLPQMRMIIKKDINDDRTKTAMINHYFELKTLNDIMKELRTATPSKENRILIEDRSLGIEGFITEFKEDGFRCFANEDIGETFISWETIEDKLLYQIAKQTIKQNSDEEKKLMAFIELKLKNYNEAFGHFHELAQSDPEIMLKYRNFLEYCELEYRLNTGRIIEKMLKEIEDFDRLGEKPKAMQLLTILREDFIDKPLAQVFKKRFLSAQSSITQS